MHVTINGLTFNNPEQIPECCLKTGRHDFEFVVLIPGLDEMSFYRHEKRLRAAIEEAVNRVLAEN